MLILEGGKKKYYLYCLKYRLWLSMRLIPYLEKPFAIRIIIYLYKKGECTVTDLVNQGYNRTTLLNRLRELKRVEILTDKVEETFPFRRTIILTRLGIQIAEILKKLEQIEQEILEQQE